LAVVAVLLLSVLLISPANAHRSGCHRWHSCPSDRGTYICGDTGYCNYCPDNQYCKAGKPRPTASQDQNKATKSYPQQALAIGALVGRAVKVEDGDSITVLDSTNNQYRIRLQGIDAPEKGQPFGNASRKHLANLVAGKSVTVKWNKRDRYGRIVGTVLVDGQDANLAQVRSGYAWHYKRYQGEQSPKDRRRYADAEDEARTGRLGLWRENNPNPPWEHRRLYR